MLVNIKFSILIKNKSMNYLFIGFDKKIEPLIRSSQVFDSMFSEKPNNESVRIKVIQYLEKGTFLTGVMSYIYDNEKLPIGNLDYYTDGIFIWPVYYLHYIKKYDNFFIDERLIEHIIDDASAEENVNSEMLKEIEKKFDDEWSGNYPKS
jgi:hypothetical protein